MLFTLHDLAFHAISFETEVDNPNDGIVIKYMKQRLLPAFRKAMTTTQAVTISRLFVWTGQSSVHMIGMHASDKSDKRRDICDPA